jgi:hypothetical protein
MTRRLPAAAALVWLAAAAVAAPPTPEAHFGHPIGQDRTTLEWSRVVSYFQALAASSDKIRVSTYGRSVDGKPMIVGIISSAANLRNLQRIEEAQRRLADPRATNEAESRKWIAEGKAVVMITCSIHATELASTQTAVEFAYRLITEDRPKFRAILDNVILLLVPSLNPDGVDIVTNWYRKTLGTAFEGTSPPELYQHYIGHDNNRDWYIFSQPETRATVSRLHNVWHPHIVYDVHQQGLNASRMFVPPWLDPIDPNVDPYIAQWCNRIGAGMAGDLTNAGRSGVAINAIYDFWTPARHYQAYHGGLRILSESASVRLASPVVVRPEEIANRALGYNPRERSWNYLEPWMGGEWHLRDIIDDQEIAMESCLYQAAVLREDLLAGSYRALRRAATRQSPYAFVVPQPQRDDGATRKMLGTLVFGGVEVERNTAPFAAGGREFQPGSWVIRMQQPYSAFAKTLLERQHYPELRLYPGGPPKTPYDVTAQTLPLLMGVEVATIEAPFTAALERVPDIPAEPNEALAAGDTNTWKAVAAAWKKRSAVWRNPATGDFVLRETTGNRRIAAPRVGLYRSWIPQIDEGWTRWLFDEFGFPYTSLRNGAINEGKLRARFDAIVFPDQSAGSIRNGYRPGTMPDEYVGGIDDNGVAALKEFAQAGGTLVFLNSSAEYAIQTLGLPVKNVLRGVGNRDFYCPGSLLNVRLDTASPLTLGVPGEIAVWAEQSPTFEAAAPGVRAIARYPESQILASGWLLGEKLIAGKTAVAEVPMGAGRVILFGMRPQYRAQSYLTFKLLFNALVMP